MNESNVVPRLFLFDGSALAYRAHFAFVNTPMSNDAGLNTGAILGYTRTLLKILESEHPTHVAVVFDTPEPTFRHLRYPEYKATREKMPVEMVEQLPYMRRMTEALGIPLLEQAGWEADDVIGTLAHEAANRGFRVHLVTGDKDFMQLVSDKITLYDVLKAGSDLILVDRAAVRSRFHCEPEQVRDVLALMGDSSDNVPGVKGIGPKKAASLIETFGSVETLYERIDELKAGKDRDNLILHEAEARLSKELVTIRLDAPVSLDLEKLARRPPFVDEALQLCRELKFNSLTQVFARLAPRRTAPVKNYRCIRTADELERLVTDLESSTGFVVDTETTSLNRLEAVIVGFSFSHRAGEGTYVPLLLDPPILPEVSPTDLPGTALVRRLQPLLENPNLAKIGQNMKYDLAVISNYGVRMAPTAFDTMIASYLLEPGARAHDLDSLAFRHFDYTKIPTSDLLGSGKNQRTMDQVPIEEVAEYAAEDADFTWRLYEKFAPELETHQLSGLFHSIEMPLVPVLWDMERTGVRVDIPRLKVLQKVLETKAEENRQQIFEMSGHTFNLDSPRQLAEVLFEKLRLHEVLGVKPQKTKTGFSTNQEVLESLSAHPIGQAIIDYRSLTKLLNTYVLELPKMVSPRTGRIHTNFNQTVAATGRLSSSDPNLQNIPIRSPLGRQIREAFVPTSDDWVLFTADYSQIELRLMAHFSHDQVMIDAFKNGVDIHRNTAAKIFGLAPEDVDPLTRSRAKSINFGILYGMGPQRLSRETGLTLAEAQEFIKRYFASFPTVQRYIEQSKTTARETGEVTTLFGRRRPLPDIHAENGMLRSAAENMAVNTPIQGSAADLIKLAMIEIHQWILRERLKGRMILQVHDELVFDVPTDELAIFRAEIPKMMSGVVQLEVPLTVECGFGPNWSAAH